MKKYFAILLAALVILEILAMSRAHAQEVDYEPIRAQIGYQTAGCMSDWIRGALNRGERDRVELVVGAVRMCGGTALSFGWTKNQLVDMGFYVLAATPGVTQKKAAK